MPLAVFTVSDTGMLLAAESDTTKSSDFIPVLPSTTLAFAMETVGVGAGTGAGGVDADSKVINIFENSKGC